MKKYQILIPLFIIVVSLFESIELSAMRAEKSQSKKLIALLNYDYDRELFEESLAHAPSTIHNLITLLLVPNSEHPRETQFCLTSNKGAGITTLSKSIAYALRRNYLYIESSTLLHHKYYKSIRKLHNIFEFTKNQDSKPILIFNSVEVLAMKDKRQSNNDTEVIRTLCNLLDEYVEQNQSLVIYTVNDTNELATEFYSRIQDAIFEIPLNFTPRTIVFLHRRHTNLELSQECNNDYLVGLMNRIRSFSIFEIKGLIYQAKYSAKRRGSSMITQVDFDEAYNEMLKQRRACGRLDD